MTRPLTEPITEEGRDTDALRMAVLDAIGEAVIATDLQGRIIHWNDAAARLYGWKADEVLGESILDITPAEDMRGKADRIMEALSRGETWSGEFLVRHRDGHHFPVLVTDAPLRDQDGDMVGVVGVSRYISPRHGAETALRESEERLDLVRRASPAVIRELDPSSGVLRWSEAIGNVFGYELDSVGPSLAWWRDRIDPEDRARLEQSFDSFIEARHRFWTEEYRFRRADGTYAEVFDRAYAAYDAAGRPTRIVAAMVDLTERRRLQEEQRLLSQAGMILDLSMDYESTLPTLTRLIVNSMAEMAVLHLDHDGRQPAFTCSAHADPSRQPRIEEVAAALASGVPGDSALGRPIRDGESVLLPAIPGSLLDHPSLPDRARTGLRELAPTSGMVLPILAREDRLGYLILFRSGRRQAYQEADLLIGEELARRIGKTVDNARLYQSAELANKAKSDFLSVISHELRTPLTAVLGYADLLAQEVSGPLNPTQKNQVERIKAGSDRLLRLLESILVYVRLETGQEQAHMAAASLEDLLARVEEIIAPRAREQGVDFTVERGVDLDRWTTDPNRVVQILLTLLTNALKFTARGAVVLRVGREDGRLVFDIVDTGHGIPEEHQPYVFNAFWQVEQPSTRRAGGAGLGLSVARRLARLMGGDVVIADSSPDGTTLRLLLPGAGTG